MLGTPLCQLLPTRATLRVVFVDITVTGPDVRFGFELYLKFSSGNGPARVICTKMSSNSRVKKRNFPPFTCHVASGFTLTCAQFNAVPFTPSLPNWLHHRRKRSSPMMSWLQSVLTRVFCPIQRMILTRVMSFFHHPQNSSNLTISQVCGHF